MAVPSFHSLSIVHVIPETQDAIALVLRIPEPLRQAYQFIQGQFLTLRAEVNGEELRRSYSICISAQDYQAGADLKVGIKRVQDGKFSNWANTSLKPGMSIDVMTPDGRFHRPLKPELSRHYLGVAGGSGITPLLSIIATTLAAEPQSHFSLLYGNRQTASIMFLNELDGLKNTYLNRLQIIHVLSEEMQEVDWMNGLLDQARCEAILRSHGLAQRLDHAFICGPEPMMQAAENALKACGLSADAISVERFGSPLPALQKPAAKVSTDDAHLPHAEVNLIVDGKTRLLKVPFQGQAILDAGLASGANLPYACKGGVCCTCRARVLEGEVRMDKNYTLEADEIREGFVLTCQSHPVSNKVVISFDER
jgi:ring-1,2-phenylacetyl-CoA epoxidase subunit PaaE